MLVVVAALLAVAAATSTPVAHSSISLSRGIDKKDSADDDSDATVFAEMSNYRNTQYTGTVYVGTPPQQFNVILDTGSANFWVYSLECTSSACRAHNQFDHQQSSTYSTNMTTFFVKYGSGRINGILCEDNIQLGSLVVPQQIFGAVTRETGSAFMWGKYDGILGLAFPTLSIEGSVPVLDTIMQQGLMTPMFSFYFSSGKSDSAFFIGGVPAAYANHVYNWHSVIRKGYWEIGLDDLVIGETSLAACPKHAASSPTYTERAAQKHQTRASAQAVFSRPDSDHQTFAVETNLDMDNAANVPDNAEDEFISELQSSELAELEVESRVWMATSVSSAASVCVQTTAELAAGAQHTLQSRMCSQVSSAHRAPPLMRFPENDAQYNRDMRCKAAVDTGTSLITGPSEAINKLQGLMGQVTNCNDLSGLPTVTFVIDGINYPLTPQQYVLQFEAEDDQPASCLLGFKALDVPPPRGPLWVLGDVFMRAYFSVFDRSQNRIGLTPADTSPNAPTDPTPPIPNLQPLPVGIDTDKQLTSTPSVSNMQASASENYVVVHALDEDNGAMRTHGSRSRVRHSMQPASHHVLSAKQSTSDEDDFWQQY